MQRFPTQPCDPLFVSSQCPTQLTACQGVPQADLWKRNSRVHSREHTATRTTVSHCYIHFYILTLSHTNSTITYKFHNHIQIPQSHRNYHCHTVTYPFTQIQYEVRDNTGKVGDNMKPPDFEVPDYSCSPRRACVRPATTLYTTPSACELST